MTPQHGAANKTIFLFKKSVLLRSGSKQRLGVDPNQSLVRRVVSHQRWVFPGGPGKLPFELGFFLGTRQNVGGV